MMPDREKVIKGLEYTEIMLKQAVDNGGEMSAMGAFICYNHVSDAIAMLKEQDELLKHEYWRGYNNGRADERGLQEGTIMQTFSPD